jgi:hypothetical protein
MKRVTKSLQQFDLKKDKVIGRQKPSAKKFLFNGNTFSKTFFLQRIAMPITST